MYDSFLARSFSKSEQKKLRYGASVAVFLITFTFITVFKPYLVPNLPYALDLRTSVLGVGNKMLTVKETETSVTPPKQDIVRAAENVTSAKTEPPLCDGTSCRNSSHENITNASNVTTEMDPDCNTTNCREEETEDPVMDSELEPACNTTNCSVAEAEVTVTEKAVQERKPLCNVTGPRTDFCNITGDIRIQPSSSSVFVVSPQIMAVLEENTPWKIKPYARKGDFGAMDHVREWSVTQMSDQTRIPKCTEYHSVPAVLFSAGGYSGNHFHSFTDIIVPLFMTSRAFGGEVKFLITNLEPWWVNKFRAILENLSNYEVIDIDKDNASVHCFPSTILGLKRHKELSIDPSKSPFTMKDFRVFLRKSYSLKRSHAIQLKNGDEGKTVTKPRLLIVSRKRTRSFTNIARIVKMVKRTGFEVVVLEPDMNVRRVAEVVNSCDVVMGVHGAGLTNILFLPDNAVFIQILPLGNVEWLSRTYFGVPSKDMDLSYLEYKIGIKESTLIQEFPLDHIIFKDPYAFHKGNWEMFKKVYLEKQNVRLDIKRFRPTLLKALELLHDREQKN